MPYTEGELVKVLEAMKLSKGAPDMAIAELRTVRKDIEYYFDDLLARPIAAKWSVFITDSKKRTLEAIDGKEIMPERTTDGLIDGIISDMKSAKGWVEPRLIDPKVIAEVMARDQAAAEKAGHPVGPIKKVNQWA